MRSSPPQELPALARRRLFEPPIQDRVFDARQVQRAPGHDDSMVRGESAESQSRYGRRAGADERIRTADLRITKPDPES